MARAWALDLVADPVWIGTETGGCMQKQTKEAWKGLGVLAAIGFGVYACANSGPADSGNKAHAAGAVEFHNYLVAKDAAYVIVWRDEKAEKLGLQMLTSNTAQGHLDLYEGLIACRADTGSEVILTDGGFITSGVRVMSGEQDGCTGIVDNAFLKSTPKG